MRHTKLRDFARDYAPIVLSAALLALSRRIPQLGFLVFVALIPLFTWLATNARRKRCNQLIAGLLFSAVYCPIVLYWISMTAQYSTVTTSPWIEVGLYSTIFLGVIVFLALCFAALFWALQKVFRAYPQWVLPGAICLWVALEWTMTHSEMRFPWLNLGYSLAHYSILIQAADIGGVYFLSALIVGVNYLLWRLSRHPLRHGVMVVVLLGLWLGYGAWREHTIVLHPSTQEVGLVQPSVRQDQKWDETFYDQILNRLTQQTLALSADSVAMVVWPESSIPVPLLRYAPGRFFVMNLAHAAHTDIFTGFEHYLDEKPNPAAEATFYNAASLFHQNGTIDEPYYKMALVPFGERMPFLNTIPALWKVSLGQANFDPGKVRHYYRMGDLRFTPLICFEVAFPELVLQGADADFYVNITNDAWYKFSDGTRQHAELARFRAIESRRTIFRAANTGYSFVVDPLGRVSQRTHLFALTNLHAQVPLWSGESWYHRYFRHFGFVLTILGGILLGCSVIRQMIGRRR